MQQATTSKNFKNVFFIFAIIVFYLVDHTCWNFHHFLLGSYMQSMFHELVKVVTPFSLLFTVLVASLLAVGFGC